MPLQRANALEDTLTLDCSKICITKINPEENDVLDYRRPLIQLEFRFGSTDLILDKSQSYLKINGEKVDFKSTNSTIYYEPKADLNGTVEIEAKVASTNGDEDIRKWKFNIAGSINIEPSFQQPQVTYFGLPRQVGIITVISVLIMLLCSLAFVVVIIGVIVFIYKKNKSK